MPKLWYQFPLWSRSEIFCTQNVSSFAKFGDHTKMLISDHDYLTEEHCVWEG